MEENFSMKWKIFSLEWKKIASMVYGKIIFHSIPCPGRREEREEKRIVVLSNSRHSDLQQGSTGLQLMLLAKSHTTTAYASGTKVLNSCVYN